MTTPPGTRLVTSLHDETWSESSALAILEALFTVAPSRLRELRRHLQQRPEVLTGRRGMVSGPFLHLDRFEWTDTGPAVVIGRIASGPVEPTLTYSLDTSLREEPDAEWKLQVHWSESRACIHASVDWKTHVRLPPPAAFAPRTAATPTAFVGELNAAVADLIESVEQVDLTTPPRTQQCPCCGRFTLFGRAAFEICRVCDWQDHWADDKYGAPAPEGGRGPNSVDLREARENFRMFGVADPWRPGLLQHRHPNGSSDKPQH